MAGNSGTPSYETWHKFFSDLANGALPYLQLYAKRSQRGSGLGGHKGSHRRFQVPIPHSTSQSGQGSSDVKLVTPTQQSVDMAKAMLKHNNDDVDILPAAIKSRKPRAKVQKPKGPARGKTQKPATAAKKKGTTTGRGKKKITQTHQDIYTSYD